MVLGALGTYFSFYFTDFLGLERIYPEPEIKTKVDSQKVPSPTILLTNDLKYTIVESLRTDFGINGERALKNGVFLVVKIEIENFGKKEVIIYGENWFLKDNQDRIFLPKTFDANPEETERLFSIRIPPGFKVTKHVGFEIPSSLESPIDLYVADKPFDSSPILLGKV